MNIVWSLLERSGDWGWMVAGVGLTALMLSVVAALMGWVWRAHPRKVISVSVSASLLIASVLLLGAMGTVHGYGRVAELLSYTNAEDAARVRQIGPVLAKAPLWLALIVAGVSAPFAGAAWYRGVTDYRRVQRRGMARGEKWR